VPGFLAISTRSAASSADSLDVWCQDSRDNPCAIRGMCGRWIPASRQSPDPSRPGSVPRYVTRSARPAGSRAPSARTCDRHLTEPRGLDLTALAVLLIAGGEQLLANSEWASQEAARANLAVMPHANAPVGRCSRRTTERIGLKGARFPYASPPRRRALHPGTAAACRQNRPGYADQGQQGGPSRPALPFTVLSSRRAAGASNKPQWTAVSGVALDRLEWLLWQADTIGSELDLAWFAVVPRTAAWWER
jgi:hypothetical protein